MMYRPVLPQNLIRGDSIRDAPDLDGQRAVAYPDAHRPARTKQIAALAQGRAIEARRLASIAHRFS